MNIKIKKAIAGNPNTPARVLRELASHNYGEEWDLVLEEVGRNPNTPSDVILGLVNKRRYFSKGIGAKHQVESLDSYNRALRSSTNCESIGVESR